MDIRPQEIDSTKTIGTLDGHPVVEVATKGGYHLVCQLRGRAIEYLGNGPHRAVARFIAKKHHRGLKITELSKSEDLDPATFMHMVPRYEREREIIRNYRK